MTYLLQEVAMNSPRMFAINALIVVGLIAVMVGIKYASSYLQNSGIISGDERENNPFVPKLKELAPQPEPEPELDPEPEEAAEIPIEDKDETYLL